MFSVQCSVWGQFSGEFHAFRGGCNRDWNPTTAKFSGRHSLEGSKFDAGVAARSAEVRKFSVGKRRAEVGRGGSAMDGRKRAGSTELGRAASKAAKRGLAKRRDPSVVWSVMAGGSAARVHTPDETCDSAQHVRPPLRNQ